MSDSAGGSLAINRYDEYGIPQVGNAGRFQYTGQVWLPEAGLYWYKARMYSPSLGRFMQTDPIGYGDGLNWYGYVGGDPVNRTDPSGLSCTNGNGYCDPGHPEEDGPLIDVQARHSGLRSGEIVPVGTGSNTSGPDTPNTGPDGGEIVVTGAKPQLGLVNEVDKRKLVEAVRDICKAAPEIAGGGLGGALGGRLSEGILRGVRGGQEARFEKN